MMDSKIKNKSTPVQASDFAISLCSNMSYPLSITYQLFWFSDEITQFLKKNTFFKSSSGIIVGPFAGFTYDRVKMEGTESVYLLGFDSFANKNCYDKLIITFLNEEEKLVTHRRILLALKELTEEAYQMNGSSFMVWPI
jgi:hypothetical protein